MMLQTVEAMIDADGKIQWLEAFKVERPTKVLVTLLNQERTKQKPDVSIEDSFGMLKTKRSVSLEDMEAAIAKRGSEF